MAFATTNDYTSGRKPVPISGDSCVVAVRFEQAMATADLALNNVGWIGTLPANCVPVALYVDGTDMDSSTAAMVLDIGLLDTAGTAISTASADGGGAWGSTTATNTAFKQQIISRAMDTVSVAATDRKIGVKVATAPTTAVAGTLGVTVFYRAA